MNYHYNTTKPPNMPTHIGGASQQDFGWDANGNMIAHSAQLPSCHNERHLCWDEQNRLQGVKDNKWLSYYQYDASGDRTYKLTGKGELQNINGEWRYFYHLDNATLYVSPYLVATKQGYTKHYYAETERIASRIGGGRLRYLDQPVVGQGKIVEKQSANKTYAKEVLEVCLDARWYDVSTGISDLYIWRDSVQPEKDCYWYHPDHLGSSSWITDTAGAAVQHLHYLPWGEDFVNQRTSSFSSMYTFSAKEKDAETGYSYFGSRYYSSDLSIWLSVDPMAAKYPSLSPYTYCANNPVKLVDPDGEAFDTNIDEDNHVITIHAVYYTTKKDAAQLKKELDAWKKKGESYCYVSGGEKYSIKFDLEINDFDNVEKARNEYGKHRGDGVSNYFQINKTVTNYKQETVNGINYEGDNMYVAKGQIRSIRHEIGHSLGLGDWNHGLMKSGGVIYGISKNNIISIFESAGIRSQIHNSWGDWSNTLIP